MKTSAYVRSNMMSIKLHRPKAPLHKVQLNSLCDTFIHSRSLSFDRAAEAEEVHFTIALKREPL